MVKARFFLADLEQESLDNNGGLIQDVWHIIFRDLELSFLNSILRTCKLFNALASSDEVFTPLLFQFYPSVQRQATVSSYYLFKPLYVADTHTLSPPARTLRDLCLYQDYQQIKCFIEKFQFEPDMLFERDANEQTVLAHVNRLQRQDLRDLLFQAIHAWFVTQAKNKAWALPIGLLLLLNYYYNDNMPFEFVTAKHHILMDFAVALNQLEFIKTSPAKYFNALSYHPYGHTKYLDFFNTACLFGHLDLIKHMLPTGPFFNNFATAVENPLSYAVRGNQAEVVEFFIRSHRRLLSNTMVNGAAELAVNDHRLAVLVLMLDFHKANFPLLVHLLMKACINAQAKAGLLIANTFPALIKNPEINYRQYLSRAASSGCTELVEFFLSQVDDTQQTQYESGRKRKAVASPVVEDVTQPPSQRPRR